MMEYNITKQYKHIGFDESQHKYINLNTNEVYTSVTTLIKKFIEPFDAEFFSQYKAIERILGEYKFALYKKTVSFKNILKHYKEKSTIDEIKDLERVTKIILCEWDDKKNASCKKGIEYHAAKEAYTKSLPYEIIDGVKYEIAKTYELTDYDNAIFPEILVFNDELKLAGQIDKVIKRGDFITVRDYKTNKIIKMDNKNSCMLYPLQNIQSCDFNTYQLQLSLYGLLIEKFTGLKIEGLYIDHYDGDKEREYICKYLKTEAQNMANYNLKKI
jgi:ATP-dependent exoDNAse (exonuclease V) beta subunit